MSIRSIYMRSIRVVRISYLISSDFSSPYFLSSRLMMVAREYYIRYSDMVSLYLRSLVTIHLIRSPSIIICWAFLRTDSCCRNEMVTTTMLGYVL